VGPARHVADSDGRTAADGNPWDGSEKPVPLLTGKNAQDPYSWSPDGRVLAYYERNGSNRDLWVLELAPRPTPRPVLVTPFNERSPFFSPDGKWLAYTSDETGRDEIYIRSFTPGGGRYVVSTDGGTEPIWSANGREMFYRNGDAVMSAAVQMAPTVSIGVPRMMFNGPYARESDGSGSLGYDVTSDGQRFLMIKQANAEREASGSVPINVITGLQNRLRAAR
jgi:serine/threonine-protein kinase